MTTIAEVLHRAADEFLWDGASEDESLQGFSCFAVEDAGDSLGADVDAILCGLSEMGLDVGSSFQFAEFQSIREAQGARYAWLKFAALIAEEQGV